MCEIHCGERDPDWRVWTCPWLDDENIAAAGYIPQTPCWAHECRHCRMGFQGCFCSPVYTPVSSLAPSPTPEAAQTTAEAPEPSPPPEPTPQPNPGTDLPDHDMAESSTANDQFESDDGVEDEADWANCPECGQLNVINPYPWNEACTRKHSTHEDPGCKGFRCSCGFVKACTCLPCDDSCTVCNPLPSRY